ncbi:MAG: S8 family serine peptidase [Ardenticatenaceae bacterium]|nr:S8 family serine peptidase [Ardenticatenaceae bacterium]MCB8987757.1 S8 family serine peptidase [Ardenticatenaceae bacterium]
MKKAAILIVILMMLFPALSSHDSQPVESQSYPQTAFAQPEQSIPSILDAGVDKLAPEVQADVASRSDERLVTVIVTMRSQLDLKAIDGRNRTQRAQNVLQSLQQNADQSQRALRTLLAAKQSQGLVSQVIPLWINNSLSVTAVPSVIREIATRADVLRISSDRVNIVAEPLLPPEPNLEVVNAPDLWALGWYGQGVVVANMDSGVDGTHADLAGSWRGGSNSWYDPFGEHATPTDLSGHGTQTMGVMVGGDASGGPIGIAPQAQWIAVKIFNDAGSSTATAIHLGFQWLLDPDGDPGTNDAPQVVNNSWANGTPGCNLDFQLDLQALRAAGIVPVFSAGNYGPNASSSRSPANNPEALAVGAVNNVDAIYGLSSRGPSSCGDGTAVFPDLVAPGVNILTSDAYGGYAYASGTSIAAPHVAGALALLLSAYPDLTVVQQEDALRNTAVDLGSTGPDNTFGYGRLDILAAYQSLENGGGDPTPTPTPTATPTATPEPGDVIFNDSLETGDFSRWTAVVDRDGDLSVSDTAAMAGTKGLSALIDDRRGMYLRDDSPQNETRYRVGFRFDPNGVSMAGGNMHRLLAGVNGTVEVFNLDIRFRSGAYQLRAGLRTDVGTYAYTAWYALADAPHTIELDWQAASAAGANDGSLSLWLDQVFKETKGGIDNDTHRIEEVRLGPQSGIDSGTAGTELFDDFVSQHSNPIWP